MQSVLKEMARRTRKDFSSSACLAAPIGTDGAVAYSSPMSLAVANGVNEAECSVAFTVCTREEDREGDIIDPRGCLDYLSEYRANSVVLYEHDAKAGGIGLSTDKHNRFHFDVTDDRIVAKCFYHMRPFMGENLSAECFDLAKRGFLLGASLGFLPVESERRGHGKGLRFRKIRITEWSQTFQPVNQGTLNEDVLRLSLSRGYIKSMTLKRRAELILPPAKQWSNGASLGTGRGTGAKSMSKLKTAAVEFDTGVFSGNDAATYMRIHHHGSDVVPVHLPGSLTYQLLRDVPIVGKKSLANGVTALLTKAYKPKDEDEDEKPTMDDEKIEKAEGDEDDEVETDEVTDDQPELPIEEDTPVEEEVVAEDEEPEPEPVEEPGDPEELKRQAQDLANVVTHFEALLDALPDMAGRSKPETSELYDKLKADAEMLIADLRSVFGDHFSDVALDTMAEVENKTDNSAAETIVNEDVVAEPEEDMTPAPEVPADDEEEIVKSLRTVSKSLAPIAKKAPRQLAGSKA